MYLFTGESHDENSENDSKKSSRVDNIATPDDINTAEGGIQQLRGPNFDPPPKLYTPSTLNIDFIQWHTHLIVYAVK